MTRGEEIHKNETMTDSNTRKKQIKTNMAILFNRTCINENNLPQYTNIKRYDTLVHR